MSACRRTSTTASYTSYLSRWEVFCGARKLDPCRAPVARGLDFLQTLFEAGGSYSVLNTARSALSSAIVPINNVTFGDTAAVRMFMKGVYQLRPPQPRYRSIWDPAAVLRALESWGEVRFLPTLRLAVKTVMLVLLASGLRGHTLLGFRVDRMHTHTDSIEFHVARDYFKQARPGWKAEPVVLKCFSNKALCPVFHLRQYIERTKHVRRGQPEVFLTTTKPWGPVARATLRRWVLVALDAGVMDTSVYSAGSMCSAFTSKALGAGAPLETILSHGGWKRSSTFAKFYSRPLHAQPASMGEFSLSGSNP